MGWWCRVVAAAVILATEVAAVAANSWCIARASPGPSGTSGLVQAGLDYACGAGADCGPIQPNGPCYEPETVVGHASYAFNSYYQRNNRAPGSCDFGGSAIVSLLDPSYGSCIYPSSASTAGGMVMPPSTPGGTSPSTTIGGTSPSTPVIIPPPPPLSGGGDGGGIAGGGGGIGSGGGFSDTTTGLGPSVPNRNTKSACTSFLFTISSVLGFLTFLL